MENWLDIITKIGLVVIPLLAYFLRIERKLVAISTDLCWIKKILKAQHTLETEEGK